MTLSFRWYGPEDPVRLDQIRQIPGVTGIVSALHDVPPGAPWTPVAVRTHRERIEAAGLRWTAVESLPVAEAIKAGAPERDAATEAYGHSLEAIGAEGPSVVCYNFMPFFDWTRTALAHRLDDGSTTLAYRHADLPQMASRLRSGGLPGWAPLVEADALRARYAAMEPKQLWTHLGTFLEAVVPVAAANGVCLALHPDDPPWTVLGLPRIITGGAALARATALVDHPANGVCLCTGSLGAAPAEAACLPDLVRTLNDRIAFVHLRNVRHGTAHPDGVHDFEETAHPSGAVDLAAVVRALAEGGFDGPARPDHGRMLWDEVGRSDVRPGYGLYDRALGATYLRGLWDAVTWSRPTVT